MVTAWASGSQRVVGLAVCLLSKGRRASSSQAWKQASSLRRKYVNILNCRAVHTKALLQTMFEKSSSFFQFHGKVSESHRVFLFSADLWSEVKNIAVVGRAGMGCGCQTHDRVDAHTSWPV